MAIGVWLVFFPEIDVQQASEPLFSPDFSSFEILPKFWTRFWNPVSESLVWPFLVVEFHVFLQGLSQMFLTGND
jgi:hypothetical protein